MSLYILRLEAIGDDCRSRFVEMRSLLNSRAPGLGDEFIGDVPPSRGWVAEITGVDPRFKFRRRFVIADSKDYATANSVGSRGVYRQWLLTEGAIYEICEPISRRRDRRRFALIKHGAEVEMTEQAVLTWLADRDQRLVEEHVARDRRRIGAPRHKVALGIDVLAAAQARIRAIFDDFERVAVSFSGGKDSTVLLHLVAEEARARGRRFGLLFIDWEAQYRLTIEHVGACFDLYADLIEPFWCCLPIRTTNACSQFEPEWTCWEPGKDWVRQPPQGAITECSRFPFAYAGMTFEEFVPAFGQWFSGGSLTAMLVGIRAGESLNRWRSIAADKSMFKGCRWTTWMSGSVYNAYPIYDWRAEDVWAYLGRSGHPYNRIYDLMHQAGVPLNSMRICEPYGDEQRRGLWLYHLLEPETWPRIVARVAGANTGALYGRERGNVLGNAHITLPAGHTWKGFAGQLLQSMPPMTAEHYRAKIAVYLKWWGDHRGASFPDELPGDTGAEDLGTWRRVCKVLLRNDYWCKGLCFSPTKAAAYSRYMAIMRKRRERWGLI